MNLKRILEWLSEIEQPESEVRLLTILGLLADHDYNINTNSESPESYLFKGKYFHSLSENQILDILKSFDLKNLVAYESKSRGYDQNRLTLLV